MRRTNPKTEATKPISILIYFAVYQRHKILKICVEGLRRLQNYKPGLFKIDLFAVGSTPEDDKVLTELEVDHCIHENLPIGKKKNYGLSEALKRKKFDYMLEVGSDDMLSNDILDLYLPYFQKGEPAFGIGRVFMYNATTGQKAQFHHSGAIGAGRCFNRKVFDILFNNAKIRFLHSAAGPLIRGAKGDVITVSSQLAKQMKGIASVIEELKDERLWPDTKNSGLDGGSELRLASCGIAVKPVDIEINETYVLDIKSDQNIHSIEKFNPCTSDVLYFLSETEKQMICQTKSGQETF